MDRIVENVLDRLLVLLFGLDLFRPEAAAEDVVLPAVAVIEGAGVLAVQVAHAVGEVREGCLDEQVVVVAEQAAGVQPPAVAATDAPQDLREDRPVPVVAEDRLVVVALRSHVVVGAGGEVATRSCHRGDRSAAARAGMGIPVSRCGGGTDSARARRETRPQSPSPNRMRRKRPRYAATLERSRCWCDGQ
jgi:hypothetical protein